MVLFSILLNIFSPKNDVLLTHMYHVWMLVADDVSLLRTCSDRPGHNWM